jgi:putative transposase
VRLAKGWLDLVAILDCFSRFVVAWELDSTLELNFVLTAVDRALGRATPRMWNSDQGSHFTSPRYLDRLLSRDIQVSMDGKGRALDNVFVERLWRSVKYEEIYLADDDSPRAAHRGLARSFEFSNHRRPHQALDYQTPAEVYFACPTPISDSSKTATRQEIDLS